MWNKKSSEIFSEVIRKFDEEKIEYFILRNHQGLPEQNLSKDVDLVVHPKKIRRAEAIIKEVYGAFHCDFYQRTQFDTLYCTHGISIEDSFGIHIDLLKGYSAKGYELISFGKMYEHTCRKGGLQVPEDSYEGFLTLITKIFGYRKPVLKEQYRKVISRSVSENPVQFEAWLEKIIGRKHASWILSCVQKDDYEMILRQSKKINGWIRRKTFFRNPVKTLTGVLRYWNGKICRIGFLYRKYKRVIAVMAPDGAGKTTLIDEIQKQLNHYFVNEEKDRRCNIIHFRPTILPNLGRLGEKAGVMKQDTDWEKPHRNKPAGKISSFFRMGYYTMDYILGWQKVIRRDVRFDRFTIFDRYGYDFLVDPIRSKINLPIGIRKAFVALMPKPDMVFVVLADEQTIYQRKQELSIEEIVRQNKEYKKLLKKRNFYEINGAGDVSEIGKEATKKILEQFLKRL